MKKIIFFTLSLFGFSVLSAQSIEEGRKQLYYENYSNAQIQFHNVLKQDAVNDAAWFHLVQSMILQNNLQKATATLAQASSAVYEKPYYQVAKGYVMLSQNKADSAGIYFTEAVNQTRSRNPGVLSAVAFAHIHSKNGDAMLAIELLNKAIKRDKRNPEWYNMIGDAYRKIDNGTEAYKAYQKALELDGNNAYALLKIGEIFLTQKNAELYLEYFNRAIAADASFAPALYQLYVHYFYHDAAKAMEYYNRYLAVAEEKLQNHYDLADLLYLNKQYEKAVEKANSLLASQGEKLQPRIYKLLAYSYAELKDTSRAISYMNEYFTRGHDTSFISKDFEALASFYAGKQGMEDSALAYYNKAITMEKDSSTLYGYFKKMATLAGEMKDYATQAKWLGAYYTGNETATNVDLFNWALAYYRSGDYMMSDSIFTMYTTKYPEQGFGYYWQARTNVAWDKEMTEGKAIPHYQKLIEVLAKDTSNTNYKKWMIEAYGYLAAYEANTQKDYPEAISYFQKVLEVDPANEDAKRYIAVLEKQSEPQATN